MQTAQTTRDLFQTYTTNRVLSKYDNPVVWMEFINSIYRKTTSKKDFSLTRLQRKHGLTDTRIGKFLQEVNIIRNDGGNGVNAVWRWNTKVTPIEIIGSQMVNKWNSYKDGGIIAVLPTKELKDIEVNEHTVTDSTSLHVFNPTDTLINNPKEETQAKQLDTLTRRTQWLIDDTRTLKDSQAIMLRDVSKQRMITRALSVALRSGELKIETKIFFGLFKIKSTIKLK